MASDATFKQGYMGRPRDPVFVAAAAIAFLATDVLVGAWFFQLVLDIRPCPLCLEQRYAYYLAIPLAALIALGAARNVSRPLLIAGLGALAVIWFANAGLGAYHAGVEWGFWQGPTDCSGPITDLGGGSLLDSLNKVKVIRCDEVQWRFLGLSLAGYNTLISFALAVLALWGISRSMKSA